MQRQRCVIGSLARQTRPTELLAAFPKLVKVLKHTVATDIPASRLPSLIQAAGDKPVKVAAIGFTPPTYNRGWSNGYPIPDLPKIQRAVRRLTSQARATTPTTSSDPDGFGSATATTRAPATSATSAAGKRGPACSTAG